MCRDAGTRLQRDDRVALALILGALDEAARVALQRDGATVEQLRPDLVQLRHLARPQEDLHIDTRPIRYASRTFAAEYEAYQLWATRLAYLEVLQPGLLADYSGQGSLKLSSSPSSMTARQSLQCEHSRNH